MNANGAVGRPSARLFESVTYTATIISTSLRVRESRIIADLLLNGVTDDSWKKAIVEDNILQIGSPETTKRSARLLRTRLEALGEGLWKILRDGSWTQSTQAALAGTIKNSRLLGDFMDLALREKKALFAESIDNRTWSSYIESCRGRDPEMPQWTDATIDRLRSSVFSILAEAHYLENTRTLCLQNVFVDSALAAYLSERGETYVLRCMTVME